MRTPCCDAPFIAMKRHAHLLSVALVLLLPAVGFSADGQRFEHAVNPDAKRPARRSAAASVPATPQDSTRAKSLTSISGQGDGASPTIEVVADGALPRLYSDRVSARTGDRIVIDVPGVTASENLVADVTLPGVTSVKASVFRKQPLVSRVTIQLSGKQ